MKHKKLMGAIVAGAMIAGAVPGVMAANPADTVKDGLVLHMGFDDTNDIAKDSSGQTTTATVKGANSINGIIGKGLQFSGTRGTTNANKIEITNRDDLKFGSSDSFSVVVWLNITSMGDSNIIGTKNWDKAIYPGWCLAMNGTNLRWVTPNSTSLMGENDYNYSNAGHKEKWRQVAIVSDKGTRSMYIDGTKVAINAYDKVNNVAINTAQKEGNFCIGADYNNQYGPGSSVSYDELKIYNRVLSTEEINYLRNDDTDVKNLEVDVEGNALKGTSNSAKAILKANIIFTDNNSNLKRSANKVSIPDGTGISWSVSDNSVNIIPTGNPAVVGFDIPKEFTAASFDVTAAYQGQNYTATVTVSQTPDAQAINGLLDGLQSQVKLALDFEGNVDGATVKGTPVYTEGETGQAIHFKNNNASVKIPNDTTAENTLKDRTIAFSLKSMTKHNYGFDPAILATNNWSSESTSGGFVWAYSWSGSNLFKFRGAKNDTDGIGLYQTGTYNEGVWEHYVVSFTDNECKLYKDGVLVKSLDTSTLPANWYDCATSEKALVIGDDVTQGYGKWDKANAEAAVDNFRIYDKVLTDEEVYALHVGRQTAEPVETPATVVDTSNITDESGNPVENIPADTYVFGAEAVSSDTQGQALTGVDFKFTAKANGTEKVWHYTFGPQVTGGASVKAAAILYNAPEGGVDCTYTPVYTQAQ